MDCFRDLHSNQLTGMVIPLTFSDGLQYVNLASNFFVGNIPEIYSDISADFRFNYFTDCHDDLCCFTNTNCSDDCSYSLTNDVTGTLPLGVESSVWTELEVFLFGSKKRIIQIETRFASTPYLLTSHACPNTTALVSCDASKTIAPKNVSFERIRLIQNVPYSSSQSTNGKQMFVYYVEGDMCSTSVKVLFCVNFFDNIN